MRRSRVAVGFDLYLVVGGGEPELARAIAAIEAAPPGRVAVQARWKDEADDVVLARTRRLLEVARPRGVPVLVNGRLDLVTASGADGVHLPEAGLDIDAVRASLPRGLVGASVHDAVGLSRRRDADFVVLGPVGDVPGKATISDLQFATISSTAHVPVLALGGVRDADDVARALRLGAHGVAVQRAILEASDPAAALITLVRALDGRKLGGGR